MNDNNTIYYNYYNHFIATIEDSQHLLASSVKKWRILLKQFYYLQTLRTEIVHSD